MRILLCLSLVLMLNACGNRYTSNYIPNPDIVYGNASFLPAVEDPRLVKGTTRARDDERMGRDGYALIGSATFVASRDLLAAEDERAVEQAEDIDADAVVVYRRYKSGGSSGASAPSGGTTVTHTTHGPRGSRSNHVTVGDSSWRVGGSSSNGSTGSSWSVGTSSTQRTYGSPMQDRVATFWRRLKPGGLGANFRNLSIAEQRRSGSKNGVAIVAVRRRSAASEADILVGDILRKVGNRKVVDAASAAAALRPYHGRSVTIVLWRKGKTVRKKIRIPKFKS